MNKKNKFNIKNNRLDFLTKQYNSLKKSLKEKELELEERNNKEHQIDTLLLDLEILKKEYESLISELKSKRVEYEILINQLRILNREKKIS